MNTHQKLTLKQLKSRYPYMFAGRNIGISIAWGWLPLFADLCTEIDAALGDDKQGFHFTQAKEKFGSARWYWSMKKMKPSFKIDLIGPDGVTTLAKTPRSDKPRDQLYERLDALISDAAERTQSMCIVCGQQGTLNQQDGYVLVLCEQHAKDRLEGKDFDVWPGEDEE